MDSDPWKKRRLLYFSALLHNLYQPQPILVSSNPGLLKLFSQPHSSLTASWTGYRLIPLATKKMSQNSSALHSASGLTYLPNLDALVVALSDGSFHVIQNLSVNPDIAESSSSFAHGEGFREWLTSDSLSQTARTTFHSTEKGNVDRSDMCRIHGMVSYDGDATFLWAYEYVHQLTTDNLDSRLCNHSGHLASQTSVTGRIQSVAAHSSCLGCGTTISPLSILKILLCCCIRQKVRLEI